MDVKDFFLNFMSRVALYSAIMLFEIATHDLDMAMLVRGVNKYSNFGVDVRANSDLDLATLLKQKQLEELYRKTVGVYPAYWRSKSLPRKQILLLNKTHKTASATRHLLAL